MQLILTYADPDKKIQAIKNIRAATGLGLKESKEYADAMTVVFPGQVSERVLKAGMTLAQAENALALLRADGWADGRIEPDPNEKVYSREEFIDAVVDAIVLARANTDMLPSQILRELSDR